MSNNQLWYASFSSKPTAKSNDHDKGVIPFVHDFNPKDMKKIKYSIWTVENGVTKKTTCEVSVFPVNGLRGQIHLHDK
jgi:hypothetical protein